MISLASLKSWGLAASLLASNQHAKLKDTVVEGMAQAALANPIVATDDGIRAMMSYEVSIAWFETGGSLELNPHGPNDGGTSHCWAQINLPNHSKTAEGWTGEELRADPLKCATVAVRIIKASVSNRAAPADCPLCIYARGFRWAHDEKVLAEAQELSKHRTDLARRLLREVPWREEERQ